MSQNMYQIKKQLRRRLHNYLIISSPCWGEHLIDYKHVTSLVQYYFLYIYFAANYMV